VSARCMADVAEYWYRGFESHYGHRSMSTSFLCLFVPVAGSNLFSVFNTTKTTFMVSELEEYDPL
jgi:Na+-driven multidrug efflux pump